MRAGGVLGVQDVAANESRSGGSVPFLSPSAACRPPPPAPSTGPAPASPTWAGTAAPGAALSTVEPGSGNTCRKERVLPPALPDLPCTHWPSPGPGQSERARAQKQAWHCGRRASPTRKAGVRPRETDWEAGHKVFTTCPKGQAGGVSGSKPGQWPDLEGP